VKEADDMYMKFQAIDSRGMEKFIFIYKLLRKIFRMWSVIERSGMTPCTELKQSAKLYYI